MPGIPKDSVVGVVGAGVMGAGIAQVAALAGHQVQIYDSRPEVAANAKRQITTALDKLVEKGKVSASDRDGAVARIQSASSIQDLAAARLVVEAIVEELEAKVQIFTTLEALTDGSTILATNTSSLSVTAVASKLSRPENFAGMHFFNPAPVMGLVEVVSGLATSGETLKTLSDTAKDWGKTPVEAKDAPGFIVNRGARPFYGEPLKFVEEGGTDIASADVLLKSVGFRMGPMELVDLVGLDINLAASRSMWQSFYGEPRYTPSSLVEARVAAGHLGRKSGKGFYDYPPAAEAVPKRMATCKGPKEVAVHGDIGYANPLFQISRAAGVEIDRAQGDGWMMLDGLKLALTDGRMAAERGPGWVVFDLALNWEETKIVALAASEGTDPGMAAGFFQALGKEVVHVADLPGMLTAKTLCMLINEACETLLHGIASKEDIDVAMKKGLNFPGGPFEWADAVGLDYVVRVLDNMAKAYGDQRYRASILLKRMALNGEKFYA